MKRTPLAGLLSATTMLAVLGLVAPALGEPAPTPAEPAATPAAAPTTAPATTPQQPVTPAASPIDQFAAKNPGVGEPTGPEVDAPDGGRTRPFTKATLYWTKATGAQAIFNGALATKFAATGAVAGGFGYPTAGEMSGANGGTYQTFQNGALYSSRAGVYGVRGAIYNYWRSDGAEAGYYGYPTSDEVATVNGGVYQSFQKGTFYWSPTTGLQPVLGAIGNYYRSFGGEKGYFGWPLTGEVTSANGGVYQKFQNGTFYWSPTTGVQPVIGAIGSFYRSYGAEAGYFGYPTTGEMPSVSGGVYQDFQKGTFYWSPASGVQPVIGAIRQYYKSFGAEKGYFGYPTTFEIPSVNGGVYQNFQKGSFYWSPATGVHPVVGSNRQYYRAYGAEAGYFGYPTTGEMPSVNGGVYQDFQKGTFYWSPTTGTQPVIGAIRQYYQRNGAERGRFGYPTGPETCNNAGCHQNFQHGAITFGPTTGAHDMYKLDSRCTYGRVVCADKTTNKMYWVVNGQIQAGFDVRFGAPGWETVNGEWTIFRKEAMSWSVPFSAWMPWSQYFHSSGMAIHYSSGFEADGFPSWGSHGCINMNNYSQAQWLYNQTRNGDRIVIYYS